MLISVARESFRKDIEKLGIELNHIVVAFERRWKTKYRFGALSQNDAC